MATDGPIRSTTRQRQAADDAGERRTIPHEDLMKLPVVRYRGTIHLVATETDLHRAVHEIQSERVVGFDTETRPTFRKGNCTRPASCRSPRAMRCICSPSRDGTARALAEALGSGQDRQSRRGARSRSRRTAEAVSVYGANVADPATSPSIAEWNKPVCAT